MNCFSKAEKGVIRTVDLGCVESPGFVSNVVITSKYNVLTFVPLNLFEQFQKAANVYFLLISIVMYISEVTTLYMESIKAYSTFLTLVVMMMFSACLAAYDDWRRHVADRETNTTPCTIVGSSGEETQIAWANVKVGQVILVKQNEQLPADMIALACSGEEGSCYVSTMNLDGETNLKTKGSVSSCQAILCKGYTGGPPEKILPCVGLVLGSVMAEAPQRSIHNFSGSVSLKDKPTEPLGPREFLLRGTVLRNTAWCLGVVVYTGRDTRVVMNSRKAPLKIANIERVINWSMLVILAFQFMLAVITDIVYNVGISEFRGYWYLYPKGGTSLIVFPEWLGFVITFFVLYSNLMPISLYATIEFCNAAQALFIKSDPEMYDDEFNVTANVRASNLCQEIGQIEYIFSDKTGTLTQNIMDLKKVFVAGQTFGEVTEEKGFKGGDKLLKMAEASKPTLESFLEVLAVAHTVVVSQGGGDVDAGKYEAESPDEGALVTETANLGWIFKGKQGTTMHVEFIRDGVTKKLQYKIIALNAFTSTRKRMSMVVQNDKGDYLLLVKGADNVMLERSAWIDVALEAALTAMAKEGLRTLVIGHRKLNKEEVTTWMAEFTKAQNTIDNREEALAAAAEKIETGVVLLGATAIEDKLQNDVAGTIVRLRKAGIKLWVLTGDKLETARNIGFSTKVLSDEMTILLLDVEDGATADTIDKRLKDMESVTNLAAAGKVVAGMMVTGAALELVASNKLHERFLSIARNCSVLIACRVSPLQKAQMVKLVRQGVKPTPVTLAVGDGANDVPMIQEAQVGVGIYGREGRQAVNSADFAIAQFRFLQRLLLVHGRYNYRRACKFTLYTFWRNAVQVLIMFYYSFCAGASGITLFEDKTRMTFNFVLAAPIIATGMFDCDVSDNIPLENPELYETGRLGMDLGARRMVECLVNAIAHSLLIFFIGLMSWSGMQLLGRGDYYSFGTFVYTCMIIVANYRVCYLNITWNILTVASIAFSVLFYLAFLLIYGKWRALEQPMYEVPYNMFRSGPFWIAVIACPLLSMCLDTATAYFFLQFKPERKDALLQGMPLQAKRPLVEQPACAHLPKWVVPFAQEKLRTTELRLTRMRISGGLMCSGAIILMLGAISLSLSRSTNQLRVQYEGDFDGRPVGTKSEEIFDLPCKAGPFGQTTTCTFSVTVKKDMQSPVWLAYGVSPFYQNHNLNILSKVNDEVDGKAISDSNRKFCRKSNADTDDAGRKIYPCGLRSVNMFNDTFTIQGLSIASDGVAWHSDRDRYANPDEYGKSSTTLSWLSDRYPSLIGAEGVKNQLFVGWWRPAALPDLVKRYGYLNESLSAGRTLSITIESRYPVEPLKARKELILSSITGLGGRDDGLGLFLLIAGGFFILFGILGALVARFTRIKRKLDDATSVEGGKRSSEV